MKLVGSLKVMGSGLTWRSLGSAAAGRHLLDAVGGDDEQERVLAGMALVRAGDRSVDLIESAIEESSCSPQAVRLLADIGSERARALLASLASSAGVLAPAAKESLDLLDRIDRLDEEP